MQSQKSDQQQSVNNDTRNMINDVIGSLMATTANVCITTTHYV